MTSNKINLIHIGLPKTGSTALQHYWTRAKHIACCWQNLAPMVSEIRQALYQFKDYDDLPEFPALQFDNDVESAQCCVYTSEALSTFVWGRSIAAAQVTKARWFFADSMFNKVPNAKILLIVRDPVDWIISIYKQFVQEGGTRTLQGFLLTEKEFLVATLNLKELFTIWSEYYSPENIILLPYEMLRTDPLKFNQILCTAMGMSSNDKLIENLPEANTSISHKEVEFMRLSSSWLKRIEKHSQRSTLTFKNITKDFSLALRSELQSRGSLCQFVNKTLEDTCLNLQFDGSMGSSLEENFIGLLHEYKGVFSDYLPGYKGSILARVQANTSRSDL